MILAERCRLFFHEPNTKNAVAVEIAAAFFYSTDFNDSTMLIFFN